MALSYDDLFQIFSMLPAKDILKFSSTSKLFSTFPKNAYFALKQSQNLLLKDDACFFIQPDVTQRYNGQVELHHYLPEDKLSSGVSNDVLEFFSNSAKVLSSSNGLILSRATCQGDIKLFIINPATQSLLPIPTPKHLYDNNIGIDADLKIGFQCESDGFMVFFFYNVTDDWSSYLDCDVYQSKEGEWKTMEGRFFTGSRSLRFDSPVLYNGVVHFISDCFDYLGSQSPYFRPYIMSYNFDDGKSGMLKLPKDAIEGSHENSCDMRIFKWGKATSANQSICLVRLKQGVFTIWSLTNYESSLWNRVLEELTVEEIVPEEDYLEVKGFAILNGDLLMFATREKVYGYGLSDMKLQDICEHGCYEYGVVSFTSYSNTLRSCDVGAVILPLLSYT